MDLAKVLHQLRIELDNLDAAIQSLEKLQDVGRRREEAGELPDLSRKVGRGRKRKEDVGKDSAFPPSES